MSEELGGTVAGLDVGRHEVVEQHTGSPECTPAYLTTMPLPPGGRDAYLRGAFSPPSCPLPPVMHRPPLLNATTRALELALGSTAGSGDRALRETIRELCADAQRDGLRSEELIVLFKATWRSRPELGTVSRGELHPVLDRVITMCIEEYYRTAAGH